MRYFALLLCVFISLHSALAQKKPLRKSANPATSQAQKRYSSLLWEITGNGLTRPSYLFGTMHVSDKLVFHLGDSFYNAIKRVNVVALENNPEYWQDDFTNSVLFRGERGMTTGILEPSRSSDRMHITSFSIDEYDEQLKAAMSVEPSMINGMMYRTYGNRLDDFEEDTFLDMYIFQVGKKLGKEVTGVENFEESERLVLEAYRDMMRDRNRKKKSFDYEDVVSNPKKIEDAYRRGDLDMLDSLETMSVFSDAFQEKFLYKRNEIQAHSIDTILKKKSLFVAVGAAHLPGRRGVIEMLRAMGYRLRAVSMDERNSEQKEGIDKIRPKHEFVTQTSDDGFFKVSIPGKKFYRFTEWAGLDVVQYADMVNGAYYMVTRVKTDAFFLGQSADVVHKKIDSLLYENIPGKILKKTIITRNGYKGWDITNKTRRGDYQRYQAFVTPFEVIIFKMSGNGEYALSGEEATLFFGSIQMKQFPVTEWVNFKPATGGFSVQLPHEPCVLKDDNFGADRMEYAIFDASEGSSFLIMKMNLNSYDFIEEDTFELNLMNDSYRFSSFVDKQLTRQFTRVNGYPALHCTYSHRDGSFSTAQFVIRGPVYYAILARYKKATPSVNRFINSFNISPFVYGQSLAHTDTLLHYTVTSPVFVTEEKQQEKLRELQLMLQSDRDEDQDNPFLNSNDDNFQSRTIGNDTIGEKIYVMHFRAPDYASAKDTERLWKSPAEDSSFIIKNIHEYTLPGGGKGRDMQLTDTGSSRMLIYKSFYTNGHLFSIIAITDTVSKRSIFLDDFFKTFAPADSLKNATVKKKNTGQFFVDYFSPDSAIARKSRRALYQVSFDSSDVKALESAITTLNWKNRNYLEVKKYLISELGDLKDSSVVPFLRDLYPKAGDTAELQHSILVALTEQRTKNAFVTFTNLILRETPIRSGGEDQSSVLRLLSRIRTGQFRRAVRVYTDVDSDRGEWPALYDSLSLTRCIFPDILNLVNVDDYKDDIMNLLTVMVDSGQVSGAVYENYFNKFYLEARQLQKKQAAKEGEEDIQKASIKSSGTNIVLEDVDETDGKVDAGNQDLDRYATLLMPFWDKNAGVPKFFNELLKTKDRRLLYNTFLLMLRNKKPVPDSLFLKYAEMDKFRAELYEDLKNIKMLNRFPQRYRNQQDIARSQITMRLMNNYNGIDTLVYIDRLPVLYSKQNGYVYFFKYKRMRDDINWQLAATGIQPLASDSINIDEAEFTESGDDQKLANDKPMHEQLAEALKEILYSKRASAASFYDTRSVRWYKTYLSDMVRGSRYRD